MRRDGLGGEPADYTLFLDLPFDLAGAGAALLTGYMMDAALATDLDVALDHDEIYAVFQPQISLVDGAIVAVEALCRWRHPERGLVAPDEFIALAEETGAIQDLGRFMLDQCLAAVDSWRAEGRDIEVSVNVSPVQLEDSRFADYLAAELHRRSLPAHALTIEITEARPVIDLDAIVPRLRVLREHGLGVSLDDFGIGYASIDQLERLPVTELKLDRSLIQNPGSPHLPLAETVARAHERGLRVVAEGIETSAHLQIARDLGCDRAQGYLLGMPMSKQDVDAMLAA